MLRIWAGNVQSDGTLPSPSISCTRLVICLFYRSLVCSFLRVNRHLSHPANKRVWHWPSWFPPLSGCRAHPHNVSNAHLFLMARQLLCIKRTLWFSVSEQERSHIKIVTQLPFPTRVSKTPRSPFARHALSSQAGSSERTQLYVVWSALLLFFFFNTIWFLLQSKVKPRLEVL